MRLSFYIKIVLITILLYNCTKTDYEINKIVAFVCGIDGRKPFKITEEYLREKCPSFEINDAKQLEEIKKELDKSQKKLSLHSDFSCDALCDIYCKNGTIFKVKICRSHMIIKNKVYGRNDDFIELIIKNIPDSLAAPKIPK